MNLKPIDRRTGLTRKEFEEEYLKKEKPVIFTDLVAAWPASQKWTFDFFKKHYGHLEVPLYDNKFRSGLFPSFEDTFRLYENNRNLEYQPAFCG